MLVEWKQEFSIGIPGVDHEHKILLNLINKTAASLETLSPQQDGACEDIKEALGEIHSQIAAHFALEEKEMKARGYTGFEAHKDSHESLLDDLMDIVDEVDHQSLETIKTNLGNRLMSWFLGHFKEFDAPLHRFLDR